MIKSNLLERDAIQLMLPHLGKITIRKATRCLVTEYGANKPFKIKATTQRLNIHHYNKRSPLKNMISILRFKSNPIMSNLQNILCLLPPRGYRAHNKNQNKLKYRLIPFRLTKPK